MSFSKLLECCVCFDEADPDVHKPKILTCLHWVCLQCAPTLVIADRITCPECRQFTEVPQRNVDALQTDFRILQLRDTIHTWKNLHSTTEKQSKAKVEIPCFNDDNTAEVKCRDCDVFMCGLCSDVHLKRQRFKDHKCSAVDKVMCGTHNREFVYFCTKCPRFLCKSCLVTQCVEHDDDIKTIDEVTPGAKEELNTLITHMKRSVDEIKQDVQPSIKEIDKKINDVLQIEQELKTHHQSIVNKVNTNFKALTDEVKNRHQMLQGIKSDLEKHTIATSHLHDLLKTAEEAQSQSTEEALMATYVIKPIVSAIPQCDNSYKQELAQSLKFVPKYFDSVGSLSIHRKYIQPVVQMRQIQILVKMCNGKKITLDVLPNETVDVVKDKVCAETNIPPHQQRLRYNGKQLTDFPFNILEYGIKQDSTLDLVQYRENIFSMIR